MPPLSWYHTTMCIMQETQMYDKISLKITVLFPVISPTHHSACAHHFHQLFFTFPHFKLQCGGGDGWAGDSLHTAGWSTTSPQEARLFLKLVAISPVTENLDFGEKLLILDFSLLVQMLLLCLLIKINKKVHSRKKSKCWVECIYTASPIPKHKSSFLHFKRQLAPSFLNRKLKYIYIFKLYDLFFYSFITVIWSPQTQTGAVHFNYLYHLHYTQKNQTAACSLCTTCAQRCF